MLSWIFSIALLDFNGLLEVSRIALVGMMVLRDATPIFPQQIHGVVKTSSLCQKFASLLFYVAVMFYRSVCLPGLCILINPLNQIRSHHYAMRFIIYGTNKQEWASVLLINRFTVLLYCDKVLLTLDFDVLRAIQRLLRNQKYRASFLYELVSYVQL